MRKFSRRPAHYSRNPILCVYIVHLCVLHMRRRRNFSQILLLQPSYSHHQHHSHTVLFTSSNCFPLLSSKYAKTDAKLGDAQFTLSHSTTFHTNNHIGPRQPSGSLPHTCESPISEYSVCQCKSHECSPLTNQPTPIKEDLFTSLHLMRVSQLSKLQRISYKGWCPAKKEYSKAYQAS